MTNRKKGRQRDRETERQRDRQTERQTDREPERQRGRETERQKDRKRERKKVCVLCTRMTIKYKNCVLKIQERRFRRKKTQLN
jgi:hypothetical protein